MYCLRSGGGSRWAEAPRRAARVRLVQGPAEGQRYT